MKSMHPGVHSRVKPSLVSPLSGVRFLLDPHQQPLQYVLSCLCIIHDDGPLASAPKQRPDIVRAYVLSQESRAATPLAQAPAPLHEKPRLPTPAWPGDQPNARGISPCPPLVQFGEVGCTASERHGLGAGTQQLGR